MNINLILKDLLKSDIVSDINHLYQDKLSSDIILRIVENKIQETDISFDIPVKNTRPCIVEESEQCCARIWNNNRETRCKSKIKDGDYCGKHHTSMNKLGYLSFGRYDEPRPTINEKGNRIPWYDDKPLDVLDILTQYQLTSLKKLIKRTEITP